MGFVVHTTAFTAHWSALPGKLLFLGFCTRSFGALQFMGRGVVFGRPVITVRGLSAACHHMGSTANGWHPQTTYAAMPVKLWFPRNRGTNMTESAHFRIEKGRRGYPLRLGSLSRFRCWRPSGVCSPYKCHHGS